MVLWSCLERRLTNVVMYVCINNVLWPDHYLHKTGSRPIDISKEVCKSLANYICYFIYKKVKFPSNLKNFPANTDISQKEVSQIHRFPQYGYKYYSIK